MRIMLHVSMNTEKTNQLVADGKMGATIEGILAKLKPETAYFHPVDGSIYGRTDGSRSAGSLARADQLRCNDAGY